MPAGLIHVKLTREEASRVAAILRVQGRDAREAEANPELADVADIFAHTAEVCESVAVKIEQGLRL
jgi:hypothetical protein